MTPIESIYEIRSDVLDLQRHLCEKKKVVYLKVYGKYEKLVGRFFIENAKLLEPEKRYICLDDVDYFLKLLESTIEHYQLMAE